MHIFRRIFLGNYWWQESDIWSQASYRYAILREAFLDPSDSYFLFADLVGFYTHWTFLHIFHHTFVSNYWWQKSDIWSQALYRYPISWEAFFDLSDSYFLFAEERGYHKWASWFFFILFLVCHLLEYCGVIFYSALLLYESYGKVNNVHQTVVQDFPRGGGVGFITVVEFVQSDTWRHPTKNDGPKVKH